MYVVDDKRLPVGVVTCTDVLRKVMALAPAAVDAAAAGAAAEGPTAMDTTQ